MNDAQNQIAKRKRKRNKRKNKKLNELQNNESYLQSNDAFSK